MNGHRWAPIKYREFYDVPRIFAVEIDNDNYLFDCIFDDVRDEYSDSYTVYLLSERLAPLVDTLMDWTNLGSEAVEVSRVHVGDVIFDDSKRKLVNVDELRKVVAKGRTPRKTP